MSDYAKYEIMHNGKAKLARLYMKRPKDYELSDFEVEVENVIGSRCADPDLSGRIGVTLDPYIASESILTEHYGYAKMVEAHYEWKPGIIY